MNATIDRLGPVGVWLGVLGGASTAESQDAAAELEQLGYGSLWAAEAPGSKDPFVTAATLLASTSSLVLGTGIANIWGRDAIAMNAAAQSLGEAFPGRFVLGLGVSHQPLVELRGHTYERPLARMRTYLDELDAAPYGAPRPADPVPRVLAALRPKMLELARDRADGAHPYFVPVEHTALAREALGPSAMLVPELAVVLETDAAVARARAREYMAFYLTAPNYLNALRWLGFSEDDLANGGSDKLVDAIAAWGSAETIAAKVKEHLAAGADHVVVQPLPRASVPAALDQLRELAPALIT